LRRGVRDRGVVLWLVLIGIVIILNRDANLAHIIDALSAARRLASSLNGWKQERDKNPNDRDYHQQLDERKTVSAGFPTPNAAPRMSFHVTAVHVESIKAMNRLPQWQRQIRRGLFAFLRCGTF
jgi:hypothetical protein